MGEDTTPTNEDTTAGQQIPNEGHPDDWVKKRLADMGLSEDDVGNVVEAGGGLSAEGGRWKICPRCKSNIDMLAWITTKETGEQWPKLLARGEVECPNCNTFGEVMGDNPMNEPHPKLKTFNAREIHNPFPWANHYVRISKAMIESNAMFPSDRKFDPDEPHWPRDLGACIIGAALIISSTIKKKGEQPKRVEDRKKWSNRGGGNKDGNKGQGNKGGGDKPRQGRGGPRQEGGGGFNF